jgi:hypothetical protein
MTFIPIPDDDDDDSEWWELDSSESIPAPASRAGVRATAAPVMAAPAAPSRMARGRETADEPAVASARTARPKWVTYAAIAGGVVLGSVAFAVTASLVSGTPKAQPAAGADQPEPEVKAPAPTVAESAQPKPSPASRAEVSGTAAHQTAIDALASAYNDIADGYAQIRDAASILGGEERIARAVERLKAAAQRGRSLPPLQAADRAAFARSSGPPLLRAVDRVILELRRLRATPGIKSNFDRLIDAYIQARREIDREIQGISSGPPNPAGTGPGVPRPPGPRGRLRGRR